MDMRLLGLLGIVSSLAYGNPQQATVVAGSANFHEQGQLLEITTAEQAVIHWNEFSIAPSETTQFIQPSEMSVVLNRVMGTAQSLIQGSLKGNGQVLLINQNGILVGRDAVIDTGSFVASSLDLIDAEGWRFKGDSRGSVVNQGTIYARNGDAVLVGYHVENSGKVHAEMGSALLGAGQELWIQPKESEKLFIRLSSGEKEGAGIANSGKIQAAFAELKADGNLYTLALRHSGEIDALGVMEKGGEIFLIAEEGASYISGSASAPGGNIFVDAEYTCVDVGASVRADGLRVGDGGNVIVWGQKGLVMHGAISAKGGRDGGNGGFVEVSSHGGMDFGWHVDVSAMNGESGHLFLDPTTVNIVTGGATPVTFMDVPPTSWAALTNPVNIDSVALGTFLDTMGSVTISTNVLPDPGFPGTITVATMSPVSWSSGNKLTLIADSSITILSEVLTSAVGLPPTQVILDLQAPTIVIGDHAMLMTPLNLGGASGTVVMDGSTSISALGGAIANTRVALQADRINMTGGTFTLESGTNDISGALVFARDSFSGVFTGDIVMTGGGDGAGVGGSQAPMAPPTSIFISSPGNMTMTGGSGAGAMANCGALLNLFNVGGSITCLLGGDLFIHGGNAFHDGKSGFFSFATATINVLARDITLIGGDSFGNDGNGVLFATFSGDFSVTSTGPNGILVQGGTADSCDVVMAAFGTLSVTAPTMRVVGGSTSAAAATVGAGSDLILNIAGDLSLTSQPVVSSGPTFIGNFGPPIHMDLNIGGDISLNAFGGFCAIAANGPGPHTLDIDARNLTAASFGNQSAFVGISDGTLNCNVLGNCTFTGGSASPMMGIEFVGVSGAVTAGFASTINITASNFFITGASASSFYTGIILGDPVPGMSGGGEIHVTATGPIGIRLDGGTASDAPAVIEIYGSAANNGIFFDVTSPTGNVVLNGSPVAGLTNAGARIVTSSGSIIDPVGGSIILNGTMSGPAVIRVGAGPAANLLLQAGVNIELLSSFSSIENLSAGDIDLVVDVDFPQPFMGPGALLTAAGSTIFTTGGALRIFTSQQPFNQILGTLNGLTFVPGPLFSNTALEQWGIYYPSLFGGFPYTIFYKNNLLLLMQQANTIASELATSLHPFNEFPGWVERFTTAREGFDAEPHFIRRRHLSHLNHPKTWTYLMPESRLID
jgi:filamentous hemagglutinin family protein